MATDLPLRGVVLAGGTGSRLRPLTLVTNKHLLPVGNEPMVFHPIRKLVAAGVTELLVVTGADHAGHVVRALGSGGYFGCSITYRVQDTAGGIAQALGLAEAFASGGPLAVVLGDNLFEDALVPHVAAFRSQGGGARILLKEVADPQRFGVAVVEDGKVVEIVEKPSVPRSPWAVTGLYFYDAEVFDIIRTLRPSGRGELEITDVNNAYLDRGALQWGQLDGWWTDAGTFESLARANRLVGGFTP